MRIKFLEPDPRAGNTATMDSQRGRQLIEAGSAVQVNDDGSEMVIAAASNAMPTRVAQAAAMAFALDNALAALPGEYTDVEYVLNGLRRTFGELLTPEDIARVRALVPVANVEGAGSAGGVQSGTEGDLTGETSVAVADPGSSVDAPAVNQGSVNQTADTPTDNAVEVASADSTIPAAAAEVVRSTRARSTARTST